MPTLFIVPTLPGSFRMSLENIILPRQHLKAMPMFNYSTSIWASGQKVQIYMGISTFYLSPDLNSGLLGQLANLRVNLRNLLLLHPDKRMKRSPLYIQHVTPSEYHTSYYVP